MTPINPNREGPVKKDKRTERRQGFHYHGPDGRPLPWTGETRSWWDQEQVWLEALRDYEPSAFWHDLPASEEQLAALERRGWRPLPGTTQGEASFVMGLPTPKQRRALEERNLWRDHLTFEEAHERLSRVAQKEGWAR
jgi:hypothetical protein